MNDKKMADYRARVDTYRNWPHGDQPKLSPRSMARAGFVYLQHGNDEVECFTCGVRIKNWEKNDRPEQEHAKFSRRCPLVEGGSSREDELDRSMENVVNRMETFVDGDWPRACPLTPTELAEAGLYYTGEGDKVVCAFCGGKLFGWRAGDIAMDEHRKHFPTCRFLSGLKHKVNQNVEKDLNPDTSNERTMEALLTATHMGYDKTVIQEAQYKLYSQGSPVTPQRLQDEIMQIMKDKRPIESQMDELSLGRCSNLPTNNLPCKHENKKTGRK